MDAVALADVMILTMTAAVAGFTSLSLALRPAVRRDQALALAALLALETFTLIDDLVIATGAAAHAPHLIGISWPAALLFGPVLLFYARAVTAPSPLKPTHRNLRALIWPALAVACTTPFYRLDGETKLAMRNTSNELTTPSITIAEIGMLALLLLSIGVALVYLRAAFGIVIGHTSNIKKFFSNIDDKSLSWLRWVLILVTSALLWGVADFIMALLDIALLGFHGVSLLFELAWVSVLALFGGQAPTAYAPSQAETMAAPKYARSALDIERMQRIAAKLDHVMRNEHMFEMPELSLRHLSDRLGVSENYVSQTLSVHLGRNFFDFVNDHRIEEAAKRLAATDAPIVQIAHDVGFNARSTFNAAFKKRLGKTPRAHRAAAHSHAQATPPATS